MAVQAQFPSNVLLLKRNSQEGMGIDCSLQHQPGGRGVFLDHQRHMFSSNGGGETNIRKRGRQTSGTATGCGDSIASSGNVMTNPFTLQQQPQNLQFVHLSQLHKNPRPHQSAVVSTGLRLSFNEQHQHRQGLAPESINSVSWPLSPHDFAAHIKQQRDETDQFLLAQGEQLRRTLAEKRQRHHCALVGAAEEAVARWMRDKEAEVEKATRRKAELEVRAAQLTAEAQVWQAKARAQEAAASSLQAQLQQAMIGSGHDSMPPEDDGGCGSPDGEDAESAYVDPNWVVASSWPCCRACWRRAAAAVQLPCRHLSLCRACDRVAQACPMCFAARESSIEVYFP